MAGIEIGGKTSWRVKSFGEFAIAFHWVNGEPAIVVFPTGGSDLNKGAIPYVLPLDSLHEIVLPGTRGEGVNGGVLFAKAEKAASLIGRGGDSFVTRKIADAILGSVDELCDMPPEPQYLEDKRQPAPVGEGSFGVRDRKTGEIEIVDTRQL